MNFFKKERRRSSAMSRHLHSGMVYSVKIISRHRRTCLCHSNRHGFDTDIKEKEPFTAGINYTSKKILQAAVIFLGFGMNLSQILAGGKQSLPIIISTITTSLIIALFYIKL